MELITFCHWLKICPDDDDPNGEPCQAKLLSHSCCGDAKKSMIFVNWPRDPPPSIQFLYAIDSTSFTHLLVVSNNDDRFNKSYGNCSIFVFLSHYWTGNPKSMLSFLCEIIDGENVMRNNPREGGSDSNNGSESRCSGSICQIHMLGPIFNILKCEVQFSYMSGPIFIC